MKDKEIIEKYFNDAVKGLNAPILDSKDLWYQYVEALPVKNKATYLIVIFNNQVLNGGLHQYFFNSYGQFAFVTVNYLNLIGAFGSAKILGDALSVVNEDNYSESQFRDKVFNRKLNRINDFEDKLFDVLDALDEKYYSLDENIELLLANWLSKLGNVPLNHFL